MPFDRFAVPLVDGCVPGLVSGCRMRLGMRTGSIAAGASIAASGVGRYCRSQAQYSAGNNPHSQSIFHVFPILIGRRLRDELKLNWTHLHATADVRVKEPRKASECVHSVGIMLRCNIAAGLLPGIHRGLGAASLKGYKANP
jgi:hypothetical protein